MGTQEGKEPLISCHLRFFSEEVRLILGKCWECPAASLPGTERVSDRVSHWELVSSPGASGFMQL